jgi:hypothetical protein
MTIKVIFLSKKAFLRGHSLFIIPVWDLITKRQLVFWKGFGLKKGSFKWTILFFLA